MATKTLPSHAPPVRKRENSFHRHELDGLLDGVVTEARRKEVVTPHANPWHCQAALAATQAAFCCGSVYLKSSLTRLEISSGAVFHPIIYAFLREAIAAPIMIAIAWFTSGLLPKRQDLLRVALLGFCLYLNQLFYIMGIDLSGVVVATCMQPTIPVFTAMLAVLLQQETGSWQKFGGIALAVGGSVCMVLGGGAGPHAGADNSRMLLGNLCLLGNTLAMAIYYLLAKQLVSKYPAMCIAAWAYLMAALCMGSTAAVTVERTAWEIPAELVGPLVYWVFVCSVIGYYVVTWATQHLPASQVASFQCLQPFLGTLLAFLVLGEQPSWWDLGAIGILAGLGLVARDPSRDSPRKALDTKDSETTFLTLAPKHMRRASNKALLTRPSPVPEEERTYV